MDGCLSSGGAETVAWHIYIWRVPENLIMDSSAMASYCVYTDRMTESLSLEHIIPLSMGGCNGFCIKVDSAINSNLGYEVDGKLANSYLVREIRRKKNYKGHSKKNTKAYIKSIVKETGQPVLTEFVAGANWGPGEMLKINSYYLPKEGRFMNRNELIGKNFTFSLDIPVGLELAFVAKVALGIGYFEFGEDFKRYVDHGSIREFMNRSIMSNDKNYYEEKRNGIDLLHRMSLIVEQNTPKVENVKTISIQFRIFASICQKLNNSCVIVFVTATQYCVSVGIGGVYLGTIAVNANGYDLMGGENSGYLYSIDEKILKKEILTEAAVRISAIEQEQQSIMTWVAPNY